RRALVPRGAGRPLRPPRRRAGRRHARGQRGGPRRRREDGLLPCGGGVPVALPQPREDSFLLLGGRPVGLPDLPDALLLLPGRRRLQGFADLFLNLLLPPLEGLERLP